MNDETLLDQGRKSLKKLMNAGEPGLHPGASDLARRILDWFSRIYCRLRYKIEATGIENIPTEGPVLVLAKHQRIDDIMLGVSQALFRRRWNVWAIMKASLAKPVFFNFFLRCGGIPINREDPRKSKKQLLHARKVLHRGNLVAIFPEQTTTPGRMGRGRSGAFRFIAGKPASPIAVVCMGMEYHRKGIFRRTRFILRASEPRWFSAAQDAEAFMHECMLEIARLTNMAYPFTQVPSADSV